MTTSAAKIIVNTNRAEMDFPLGQYSAVADKKGSIGHQLRRLRLMPGVNRLDKAIIGQGRAEVGEADLAKLMQHPDFKRQLDMGRIRLYDARAKIDRTDRITFAANTIDLDVLENWLKEETDDGVKIALKQQIKRLHDRGQAHDDRQIAEQPARDGQAPNF